MADLETSHATLDHTGLTGVGGAPAESDVTFTDITTNNASTSKHGYLKKLDNNAAHFMDGTGAWSTPSGSGTSLNPGTSFPGSPSTNDLCFRTDRGILYYYDGTRWLSLSVYYEILSPDPSAARPQTTSGNGIVGGAPSPNYDWWMEAFEVSWYVQTTNDGSKYWTATLRKHVADDTPTTIVTINSSADTASNDISKEVSIGALLDHSTYKALTVVMTKTSTPGNFYWQAMKIRYRLVG